MLLKKRSSDALIFAPNVEVAATITLDDQEELFFGMLLDMVRKNSMHITLRVAGGWVRDKLLGLRCHDIDIALDKMMGKDFALCFNTYLSEHNHPTHHVGVIQTNPEQSKHLETAAVHILDFFVDFVNLRAESYEEDSRIPSLMRFGTPHEDALRRDITINTLYYNIHSGQVEDFTGKGFYDLKNGIVRTPMPPLSTFHDDPLRVLRVIRFANRFAFSVDDETKKAIKNPAIRNALRKKISRERIGIEVDKMLRGPNPLGALESIADLHLFDTIFMLPEDMAAPKKEQQHHVKKHLDTNVDRLTGTISQQDLLREHGDDVDTGHDIKRRKSLPGSFSHAGLSFCRALLLLKEHIATPSEVPAFLSLPDTRRLAFLSGVLMPVYNKTYLNEKGKPSESFKYIIHSALKFPNRDVLHCEAIFRGINHFSDAVEYLYPIKGQKLDLFSPNVLNNIRLSIGSGIKAVGSMHWMISAQLAAIHHMIDLFGDAQNEDEEAEIFDQSVATLLQLFKLAYQLDVALVYEWKPLLNGSEIAQLFDLRGGPAIGKYLELVFEWQLLHPEGDVEKCRFWLQEKVGSITESM